MNQNEKKQLASDFLDFLLENNKLDLVFKSVVDEIDEEYFIHLYFAENLDRLEIYKKMILNEDI